MEKQNSKFEQKVRSKVKGVENKSKIIKNEIFKDKTILDRLKGIFRYILKKVKISITKFLNSKHHISDIIEFILGSRLIIIWLIIILYEKAIFFYDNVDIIMSEGVGELRELMTLIFVLVTVSPLLFIKKNKNRFRMFIVFDIFLSILLFADNLYYQYSTNMLSISQITYVKYAEEIGGAMKYLLKQEHLLYFVDIPIFLFVWIISRLPLIKNKTKIARNRGKRRLPFAILYIILLYRYASTPIMDSYQYMVKYPFMKIAQVSIGSVYGYHYLDIYNSINVKETTKYKTYNQAMSGYNKLSSYYEENYTLNEEYSSIAKGKNVIVLQLESVQEFVKNRKVNGQEITPNLNKFFKENIDITNMISQSYSTTADSEYSVMTSLYPLDNGQSFSMYNENINNDIFTLYKNSGYHTSYMHGNIKEFWCRAGVYGRLPIDETSFIDSFENINEYVNSYMSDEILYRQGVKKLTSYKEPFYTSIVSASSHTPYSIEGVIDRQNKLSFDVGKYKDTEIGNYLETVNYADYAFGVFIDELKANNLYENSIIVVFGDHNGLGLYNESLKEFLEEQGEDVNEITQRINFINVLCGMRIPGVEKVKITKPVSKLDIKPTLLQISGIEDDFSLGKSIFSTKDYAYISNTHIVTSEFYYSDDGWHYIKTGEEVDLNNITEKQKRVLLKHEENMNIELNLSRSLLINNLLR